MGEEHWLTDPRFKDDITRGDNGSIVSERMSRWWSSLFTRACCSSSISFWERSSSM